MLKIQVFFKNGHSIQGETFPENVSDFIESVNEHRTKGKSDSKFFEIKDYKDGKIHCIFINLSEVNSIILEESHKENKQNEA